MAIKVETVDCTSLGDSDLEEMANICTDSSNAFGTSALSEQVEAWVLLTQAREGRQLRGFLFCTLERIGGTPCVLIGAGHVSRTPNRDAVLQEIVTDQMRRAALSFPDEDVLFGAQINNSGGFEAFERFHDVIPRPGRKPTGEDRAWGKRLAKRFGISLFNYEDRFFTSHTKNLPATVIDHKSLKPQFNTTDMTDLLHKVVYDNGDTLLVHGWVMSEELEILI